MLPGACMQTFLHHTNSLAATLRASAARSSATPLTVTHVAAALFHHRCPDTEAVADGDRPSAPGGAAYRQQPPEAASDGTRSSGCLRGDAGQLPFQHGEAAITAQRWHAPAAAETHSTHSTSSALALSFSTPFMAQTCTESTESYLNFTALALKVQGQ